MPGTDAFSIFAGKFNALIIDPQKVLPLEMLEFFDNFPLFKVRIAWTCEEAEKIADTISRWHVCIMCLKGHSTEACSFLKKNTPNIPVVAVLDELSLDTIRECEKLAVELIIQIKPDNQIKIMEQICEYAALNAFNPIQFKTSCPERMKKAARNLIEKPPINVSDWASNCQMCGKNMQVIWTKNVQFKANVACLLGRLAIAAMCTHLGIALGTNRRERIPNGKVMKRLINNYKKKQGYYEKILFGKLWSWVDKSVSPLVIAISLQFLSDILDIMEIVPNYFD